MPTFIMMSGSWHRLEARIRLKFISLVYFNDSFQISSWSKERIFLENRLICNISKSLYIKNSNLWRFILRLEVISIFLHWIYYNSIPGGFSKPTFKRKYDKSIFRCLFVLFHAYCSEYNWPKSYLSRIDMKQ